MQNRISQEISIERFTHPPYSPDLASSMKENMTRPKPIEAINRTRELLWIFGLYHSKKLKKHRLHAVNRVVILVMVFSFPILLTLQLLLSGFDLEMYLAVLVFLIGSTWAAIKIALQAFQLKELIEIEDLFESDIFNSQTKEQDHFLWQVETKQKLMLKYYWLVCFSVTVGFSLCPILTNYSVTIPIWIPIDNEVRNTVAYVYESVFFAFVTSVYPVVDVVIYGFTLMVTAQFKILKDNLKNSCERNKNENYWDQEKMIQKRLRAYSIHHNILLKILSKLQDWLSPVVFLQVSFSVLELGFSGIQLVVVTDTISIAFDIMCFGCLLGQVCVTCWWGQEIINESCDLVDACYMSEWYMCGSSTRKCLMIFMANTQQPIVLYAGKLFTISFSTFAMRSKPIEAINCTRKLLWVFGLYHSKKLRKRGLYKVNQLVTFAVLYLFPILLTLQLLLSDSDIEVYMSILMYLLASTWGAIKISLQVYQLKKLIEIEELFESDIFNPKTKEQDRFIWEVEIKQKLVLKCYRLGYFCVPVGFFLCPLVTNYSVTTPIWIPVDYEMRNTIAYIYESCYYVFGAAIYPVVDVVIFGLTLMVTAQFKILKNNLRNSCERNKNENYWDQEQIIQRRLRACTIHHNAVLKILSKLQGWLSPVFFLQVSFSVLLLGLAGIQFVVKRFPEQSDKSQQLHLIYQLAMAVMYFDKV
ncbi:hypothetical protein Trydic_g10924 [Trypoxylus dichotomus]